MKLGGFCPLPATLGGGRPRLQTLFKSLNQGRGTGYDTGDNSNVIAETMAEARALDAAWSGNRRAALQFDAKRMTAFIPRWEKILDLHPRRNASDNERRRLILAKYLAWAGPELFEDAVRALTGDSFVGIEFHPLSTAVQRWPVNGYPNNWTSSTAHVLIRVQVGNQTNAEFWNMRAELSKFLQDYLPFWMEFDVAIHDSGGGDCFLLDEPNLDLETFCT